MIALQRTEGRALASSLPETLATTRSPARLGEAQTRMSESHISKPARSGALVAATKGGSLTAFGLP